ncbi:uncharacterized protein LOC132031573 [Lycium ferocissimum]|uniref:uncharacterized protein LOC132031573 n=1 Tax=Lycium ferocissimum TaxID=112874 RepID=UPI002814A7F1|nr:uncharacterized protein LOC132031573 [Lycium ferocissimum]
MVTAFPKKCYPPSKKAEIYDKIYEFKQRLREQLYEAWERFKEYLQKSSNHSFPEHILIEKFYRGLDLVTQPVTNNAADGCFINKSYQRVTNILDKLTTHNQAWHSNNADVVPYELAKNISLLTKKFDETQIKKVNVCEDDTVMPKGMYQTQDGPFHNGPPMQVEDANYVNNSQGGYKDRTTKVVTRIRINGDLSKVKSKSERTLSGLTKIVVSHAAAIQKLKSQMRYISREQHPPKKEGLPSDTIPNPKNGGGGVDRVDTKVVDLEPIDEEEEVQSEAQIIIDENPTDKKVADIPEIVKEADNTSKQTRLVKKKEDAKFEKFYDQLKQLSLNFPFLEVVKEVPSFSEYLKDLLTKKKTVQHETVSLTHTVSSIISTTTVQKKGDPGAFTIPCLGVPRLTTMRLQMADRSIKRPVGVVDDVLVRVGEFMLLADFVILDYVIDRDILIILERPFLATGRAQMDSEKNEIKFLVNDEEVMFQASKGMKLPSAYESISIIDSVDMVDEAVEFKMEKESLGEALVGILVNFDAADMEGYMETVNSLVGLGSYSYHPKKLNLDLENRTTLLAKPSIIEPPKLELKQLPSHLKYQFIGPNNALLVIVLVVLTEEQILQPLEVLCEYKCAIGLTITDIRGIPFGICEHKIKLEEDSKPSVEHQRRLN